MRWWFRSDPQKPTSMAGARQGHTIVPVVTCVRLRLLLLSKRCNLIDGAIRRTRSHCFGMGMWVRFGPGGITHFIKVAALAAGFPSELAGSHSLRKGVATAFFASTGDLERLKRYGGWSSDAVHAYLYEDHTAQKGISSGTLQSQVITLPKQRDPNYEPPLQKVASRFSWFQSEAQHCSGQEGSSHILKRVSFATMAGSLTSGRRQHCSSRLQPAGSQRGMRPRKKARVIHRDKFAGAPEEVRERKSNEFKLLTAARDILLDPFTAARYVRWFRSQRARPSAAGVPPAKASSAAGAPPPGASGSATTAPTHTDFSGGQASGYYARQAYAQQAYGERGNCEEQFGRSGSSSHRGPGAEPWRPSASQRQTSTAPPQPERPKDTRPRKPPPPPLPLQTPASSDREPKPQGRQPPPPTGQPKDTRPSNPPPSLPPAPTSPQAL